MPPPLLYHNYKLACRKTGRFRATKLLETGPFACLVKAVTGVCASAHDSNQTRYTTTFWEAPPEMGSMDIGFILSQNGNQLTGYVDLGSTLIFTREHTIRATPIGPTPGRGTATPAAAALEVGPSVSGTFDGVILHMASERFAMTSSAGQHLQRQFRLIGAADAGDIHRLSGAYRETIWGLGPQPLTLVGTFTLVQPTLPTPTPTSPVPTMTPTLPPGAEKVFLPMMRTQ